MFLFLSQYLEWRFDKSVRILASALFTLQMVLYMSIVVYAPALAVEQSEILVLLLLISDQKLFTSRVAAESNRGACSESEEEEEEGDICFF